MAPRTAGAGASSLRRRHHKHEIIASFSSHPGLNQQANVAVIKRRPSATDPPLIKCQNQVIGCKWNVRTLHSGLLRRVAGDHLQPI